MYLELMSKYEEDFPVDKTTAEDTENRALLIEKIESNSLSKKDLTLLEPVFNYGHMDVHKYLKAKKRFIWF